MIARQHISADVPFLKSSDTIGYALEMMEDYKFSQLPVLNEKNEYLGILEEDVLLGNLDFEIKIEKLQLKAKSAYIEAHQHLYEALRYIVDYDTSIVPVVQNENEFIGAIDAAELVRTVVELTAVSSNGAILVLGIKQTDYSLAEIARIVEGSGAKVLSSTVYTKEDEPTHVYVTLKLNQEIISDVISAFNRYEYHIVASFQEKTPDDDKDRLDHLFKYLDI